MTTDNLDITAIRERAERASAGPWEYDGDAVVEKQSGGDEWVCQTFSKQEEDLPNKANNGPFIAYARTDILKLCDEVERLRSERTTLLEAINEAMLYVHEGECTIPRYVVNKLEASRVPTTD